MVVSTIIKKSINSSYDSPITGMSGAGFAATSKTGLAGAGATIMGQSNQTLRSQQPFSFKAAIDQLEEEIMQLKQEVSFARKEVRQLKGEQDTVEDVAKAQCADIQRYLEKEIAILDDVQIKANKRQTAENQRFQVQISQVRQICEELDDSRLECVQAVRRVESNLGIWVDPNEKYKESLQEKMADALVAKLDNAIIK